MKTWTRLIGLALTLALGLFPLAGAQGQSAFVQPGVDMPGGDFLGFSLLADSPAACQRLCAEHVRCRAYTYVRPNTIQGPLGRCYLKDSTPAAQRSDCCISGVKPGGGQLSGVFLDGGLVRPVIAWPAPEWRTQTGYGSMPVSGIVPALVIVTRFGRPTVTASATPPVWPRSITDDDVALARRLMFDPERRFDGQQSVASFYLAASGGRVHIVEAAVLGPYDVYPGTAFASVAERDAALARYDRIGGDTFDDMVALADPDFDFAPYDRNGDGVVDPLELIVIQMDDGTTAGAAARGRCVGTNDGVRVCPTTRAPYPNVAAFGIESQVINLAHEIGHTFGAYDLYGPTAGFCWSEYLTLMSCTAFPSETGERGFTFDFDPWHRMAFGWAQPRFARTDVRSEHFISPAGGGEDSPVLLYSPDRGMQEFFLIERRSATHSAHDRGARDVTWGGVNLMPAVGETGSQADGVVIWYVDMDVDTGRPFQEPRFISTGPNGRLDSTRELEDDLLDTDGDGRNDTIAAGADNVLQSSPSSDDVAVDFVNIFASVSADAVFSGRRRAVFPVGTQNIRLFWRDGGDAGVSLTVLPGADGRQALVRIAPQAATPGSMPLAVPTRQADDAWPRRQIEAIPELLLNPQLRDAVGRARPTIPGG